MWTLHGQRRLREAPNQEARNIIRNAKEAKIVKIDHMSRTSQMPKYGPH